MPVSIALLVPARLNVLGQLILPAGQVFEVIFLRSSVTSACAGLSVPLAAWQGFMHRG